MEVDNKNIVTLIQNTEQLQQQQQQQPTVIEISQAHLQHQSLPVVSSMSQLMQPQQNGLVSMPVSQNSHMPHPHVIMNVQNLQSLDFQQLTTAQNLVSQQPQQDIKTLQVGQVLQTVPGPNGTQHVVQIQQHDFEHLQTAQLAQLAQHNQLTAPIPVAIIKTPTVSTTVAEPQVTKQPSPNNQNQPAKPKVPPIKNTPTVKKLMPDGPELLKESKERFLKLPYDHRKEFLNWMVWRLNDVEVDLLECKLEKKRRLKTRKGKRRQTGATGEKHNVCQYCPKSFRKKTHLIVHERVHTGEKPYVCHICDKSFAQSTGLKTHLIKHTIGETPYECSVCGKQVTTKGNLKLHEKLHTGERPFPCEHCDKAFPRKSALNRHMWIHSGERPFQCKFCEKTFRRKSDLDTHERIHTGVKPYACKYCGKAFSDQRNWKAHERKHSGAMNCRVCGRGPFQKNKDLKNHMAIHENSATVTELHPQVQVTIHQPQPIDTNQQQQPQQQQQMLGVVTAVTLDGNKAQIEEPVNTVNAAPQTLQLEGATILGVHCQYCGKLFKEAQHLEAHIATAHMDAQVAQLEAHVTQHLQYQTSFQPPLVQVQTFN